MRTQLLVYIIVSLLLLANPVKGIAQQPAGTETKEAWLTITDSYKRNDTVLVYLAGTEVTLSAGDSSAKSAVQGIGLTQGALVKSYRPAADGIKGQQAASGLVENGAGYITAYNDHWVAIIKLYNPADTLEESHLVKINLSIPVLPYRSVFTKLALSGIIFTDNNKLPFYSLHYLLKNDSKAVEDSIYRKLLETILVTHQRIVDKKDAFPVLLAPISQGRYKGKNAAQAFIEVNRSTLEAFLLYALDYPVGYMGQDYRLSESFAGWVVSGGPMSARELQQLLLPAAGNKTLLTKYINQLRTEIASENYTRSIAVEATDLSDALKFAEANKLVNLAVDVAEIAKDTGNLPAVYTCRAQVYLDMENYKEAIRWYEKAVTAARQVRNKDIEIMSLVKKGYCLSKSVSHAEGELAFRMAERQLQQYRDSIEPDAYNNTLRKIFEFRSDIHYRSGKYTEALRLLDSAIAFNNKVNNYDARITNARYYKFIGQVYNEQNRPQEALTAFEIAGETYKNANDYLSMAQVENQKAYSYIKAGQYEQAVKTADQATDWLIYLGDFNNAGYGRSLSGTAYWNLGKYDTALAYKKASVQLRRKSGNASGEAGAWSDMGELFQLSGSRNLSMQAFDSALAIYRSLRDSAGIAEIYNHKGDLFFDDENYKKAAYWYGQAKGVNPKTTLESIYKTGITWLQMDTAKARPYLYQAYHRSVEDGNKAYQLYAAKTLASYYYALQDAEKGDEFLAVCEQLSRQMNTSYVNQLCLALRAFRAEKNAALDSAIYYYGEALHITDTSDRNRSIDHLNAVAAILTAQGEFERAAQSYDRASREASLLNDSLALGSTFQAASFLCSRTAEFERGLKMNDSALAIFRKAGLRVRYANAFVSRGSLFSAMGDNRKAVEAYLLADSIFSEEGQEESRLSTYNNIGVVYNQQGDYNKALKYLQFAAGKTGTRKINEDYLMVQGNIADALVGLKRTNEAKAIVLDIFPQARRLKFNRIASGLALLLGKIYLEEKNATEALNYYTYARDYAISSGEQEKLADALLNLARVSELQNDLTGKQQALNRSIEVSRKYRLYNGWEALYEYGLHFYNLQQADSAIRYFREAVELLDRSAENLYGGDEARKIFTNDPRKADLYNKIVFSYYQLGNIREAWSYANRSSIAGIKELSGSLSPTTGDEEKNEALRKLLSLQQSKKALEKTLDNQDAGNRNETLKKIEILEADYNNFLQDVVAEYPELGTYFSRSNADEFNNYKGKLPADLAVALYLLNDQTLMIFTLTNEKLAVDTMHVDIAPKINAFIRSIKNTQKASGTGPLSERSDPQDEEAGEDPGDFRTLSDELYRYLIASVQDKIAAKKKLCIIPTGIFANMPFQCLGKNTAGNQFRFLLEEHGLFYTNKMSVFGNNEAADSGDQLRTSFAAFGVPDAKLQFNIAEVKTIGKLLGSDSTVYADNRATEGFAKQVLKSKRYIHFATHGVLNYSSDYSQSYLKLLPDKDTSNGNNGQLTMREIQRLGIRDCDMVILSACQTAVSKELVEGWSISPANSFLVSHVKSVVASLWKVADEPTGLLMQYFYENLVKGQEKQEALRQAQIRLSQDARYRHPNYWGAFVLYGDWR